MKPMIAVSKPSMAMTTKQRNSSCFWSGDTGRASMNAWMSTTPWLPASAGRRSVVFATVFAGIGYPRQETHQRLRLGFGQRREQTLLDAAKAWLDLLQHFPSGRGQREQLETPIVGVDSRRIQPLVSIRSRTSPIDRSK